MKSLSLMLQGMKDAFEIIGNALAVSLKSPAGRVKVFMTFFFVLFFILISFFMPYMMTVAIGQNTDLGNMNVFEFILASVTVDKGRAILSYYLLGVIVFTLFTPIASNSLLSVYNKTSMVSIRKNDTHKVSESIILQLVSVTNLLVFFSTIVISSLFSYAYSYDVKIFIVLFMVWILGLSLTGFNGWAVELVLRKWGPYAKTGLIGIWIISALSFFFIFYYNDMLIYGFTDIVIKAFTSVETTIIIVICLIALSLLLVYTTFRMGLYTINQTAPYVSDKVKKVNHFKYVNQILLTFKILWRSGNVRAPVLLISLVSIATVAFVTHEKESLVGFLLAAPMVIGMSVAVNFFGIIGSGNAWVFSVGNFSKKVLEAVFFYNILFSFTVSLITILPATVLGMINYNVAISFIVCSLISIITITLVALYFAVFKPNKYDVHIRGENILPPSKSLTVLLVIVFTSGIPSSLLFMYGTIIAQSIVLVVLIPIALFIVSNYTKKLNSGYTINNIISETS